MNLFIYLILCFLLKCNNIQVVYEPIYEKEVPKNEALVKVNILGLTR